MKKIILVPIIIGASLLTVGGVLLSIAIAKGVNPANAITKDYSITESFNKIDIDADITDIEFVPSTDDSKKITFQETDKYYHTYSVTNDTLVIRSENHKKWYDFFNINSKIKATLYLPAGTYTNLKINNSTGDIEIPHDFSFNDVNIKLSTGDVNFKADVSNSFVIESSTGDLNVANATLKSASFKASTGRITLSDLTVEEKIDINVSTGRINLKNVHAKNYQSKSSTGDVTFEDTVIAEHLDVKTSTGDVKFIDSDAATLKIKTDTGDVTGTLLTDHRFVVETDSGKKEYPKYTDGGLCEIETDTGDIKISIKA